MTPSAVILTPALALVCWTLVMWIWMYATRHIADNYNHLHEQPVLFYALVFYTHLAGTADVIAIGAAWTYVAMRVIHSLFQALVNFVPARFGVFVLGTIPLFVLAIRNLTALA